MEAKAVIGRFIRKLREQKQLTQEQLAGAAGITYQFLSGMENGRENFSIDVLESLAKALGAPLPQLVSAAFAPAVSASALIAKPEYFRPQVPLPPGMKLAHLEAAINATQTIVSAAANAGLCVTLREAAINATQTIVSGINANLLTAGAKPLPEYIQGNNFSGLVSNMLCDALNDHSPYKHNSHQAYPDLINASTKVGGKPAGLEIKSTIQIGKGGESHNGHSGWHLVACFQIEAKTGNIRFIHLMFAVLNGHTHAEPDWTYVGSKVNTETGSRRTETYNTTLIGLTKLRDGSAFLDPDAIDFKRWRQQRRGPVPFYSIFPK